MRRKTNSADVFPKSLPREIEPLIDALVNEEVNRGGGRSGSSLQVDRTSTIEIVRRILALGYRIEPSAKAGSRTASCPDDSAASHVLERLRAPDKLELTDLLGMWNTLSSASGRGSPEAHELLGQRILAAGEPILAYDVLSRGLELWSVRVRMQQLMALALARSGATPRANEILRQLRTEGHNDGETLGILARTHKDLAEQAVNEAERLSQLRQAHGVYLEAYQIARQAEKLDDAIYTGINAATTGVVTGARDKALEIARSVSGLCRIKLQAEKDYWALASLGEAAVILSQWNEAEEWYTRAVESAPGNFGNHSSTRRQARMLLDFLGMDRHRFDHCFHVPKVLVFSDLLMSNAERNCQPLSQSMEEALRRQMASILGKYPEKIGYCGVERVSGIVFAEEMLQAGGEINLILPVPRKEIPKVIADIMPDHGWQERLQGVMERAASVIGAGTQAGRPSQVVQDYSILMQHGLALLRAQRLDTEVVPLVVCDKRMPWDGGFRPTNRDSTHPTTPTPRNDVDGALVTGQRLRGLELEPEVIDLSGLVAGRASVPEASGNSAATAPEEPRATATPPGFPQRIVALLVADIKGFSTLAEERFPQFVQQFLGTVAELVAHFPGAPLIKNTWGDALYFVFAEIGDAGRFALELQDRLRCLDWGKKEKAGDLELRIALHAGPVFTWTDPVIEQSAATGWHVVRTARLEPITPPGQVYASQAFAALAAAAGVKEFTCDYVGEVALAKDFGTYPTYHIRRKAAILPADLD